MTAPVVTLETSIEDIEFELDDDFYNNYDYEDVFDDDGDNDKGFVDDDDDDTGEFEIKGPILIDFRMRSELDQYLFDDVVMRSRNNILCF